MTLYLKYTVGVPYYTAYYFSFKAKIDVIFFVVSHALSVILSGPVNQSLYVEVARLAQNKVAANGKKCTDVCREMCFGYINIDARQSQFLEGTLQGNNVY